MTALPIIWGEGGPADVLAGRSGASAAYRWIEHRYDIAPIDSLSRATLRGHRLLLIAQPSGLAPAELVALDTWVRAGGRALILTDPALVWPSELALGDPRRPPAIGLLDPLLAHWGLELDDPADAQTVVVERRLAGGHRIRTASPGTLRSSGSCAVDSDGLIALCRMGSGKALIVADADLLDDPLAADADNFAAVGDWLEQLTSGPTRSD